MSLWLMLILVVVSAASTWAQEIPGTSTAATGFSGGSKVRLTRGQTAVFQDALQTLAQQGHVTVVAEGAPLHPTLPAKDIPDLSQDAPPPDGALQRLADAYDYDVQFHHGVYRLTKRYSDPNDMPGVTLEECTLAMQDVVNALKVFALDTQPNPRRIALDPIVESFAATLTPEQMQSLQDEKIGLPVTSLTPEQQTLVTKVGAYFYIQAVLDEAQRLLFRLRQAPKAAIGKDIIPMMGISQPLFGYDTKDLWGRSYFATFNLVATNADGPLTPGSNPPNPLAPAKIAGTRLPESATKGPMTLGREAAALSTRGAPVLVDPALRAKPVSVAGESYSKPSQVVEAMGDVYGLRVEIKEDGTRRLARPLRSIPLSLAGVGGAVWNSLPLPLQRAIHKDERETLVQEQAEAGTSASGKQVNLDSGPERMQQHLQKLRPYQDLPDVLHAAAVAKLRLDVDPALRKGGPKTRVPVSALTEADRAAFGVALISPFLGSVRGKYDGPMPEYITRFDEVRLFGGPYINQDTRSRWKFALNARIPDASVGGLRGLFGMSNIVYSPPDGQ